jgi:hypothetical protein
VGGGRDRQAPLWRYGSGSDGVYRTASQRGTAVAGYPGHADPSSDPSRARSLASSSRPHIFEIALSVASAVAVPPWRLHVSRGLNSIRCLRQNKPCSAGNDGLLLLMVFAVAAVTLVVRAATGSCTQICGLTAPRFCLPSTPCASIGATLEVSGWPAPHPRSQVRTRLSAGGGSLERTRL